MKNIKPPIYTVISIVIVLALLLFHFALPKMNASYTSKYTYDHKPYTHLSKDAPENAHFFLAAPPPVIMLATLNKIHLTLHERVDPLITFAKDTILTQTTLTTPFPLLLNYRISTNIVSP